MFGVLKLNKGKNASSRDVVNVVQRLVKPHKAGHAGTLDPMATGVLLVCVGKATKLISVLQDTRKVYSAEFLLGQRSDTDDATGNVVHTPNCAPIRRETVESALRQFVGEISQVPPVFSAIKKNGQRAYAKARRGETVELEARPVTVYSINVVDFDWPRLTLTIECGSGTYIRSIARDLGNALECGALMSSLVRTAVGEFSIDNSVTTDDLTAENVDCHLTDPVEIVQHLNRYRCDDSDEAAVAIGRPISVRGDSLQNMSQADDRVAMTSQDGDRLLAMGIFQQDRCVIQPRNVFI